MKLSAPPADLSRGRASEDDQSFWDRQLRARIGQDLRSIFETSLSEPVPEHLSNVLREMEGATGPEAPAEPNRNREGRSFGV